MSLVESIFLRNKDLFHPHMHGLLRDIISKALVEQEKTLSLYTSIGTLQKQILIDNLVEKFRQSIMPVHEAVGVIAALVAGENTTQQSLGSKHTAGIKRGATGFKRVEQIVELSKVNISKIITTPIEMGDYIVPRPKEEIHQLANSLISVRMNDIHIDHEIIQLDVVPDPDDPKVLLNAIYEKYPWYKVYLKIPHKEIYGNRGSISPNYLYNRWLRVYLDPYLLYKHRIRLSEVADIIQEDIKSIVVVYPPSTVQGGPFLDIHFIGPERDSKSLLYKKFADILERPLSGILTVEDAYATSENLLTDLTINSGNNEYIVSSSVPNFVPPYAWAYMLKAMIPDINVGPTGKRFTSSRPLEEVRRMILECPLIYADVIKTKEKRENGIYVTFKTELVNEFPYLEYANLSPRIFGSDKEVDEFSLDTMVDFHLFWYIEVSLESTKGSISDLFFMPEIDPKYTFTLSPHDCIRSIGYLAMRNMIYQELKDNISIDSSHLKLIINNITLYADPVAMKREDLVKDKTEWLTYATFEKVFTHIIQAAFCGETDHMTSAASQILTGQMITIGRGGNNLPPEENPFVSQLKARKNKKQTEESTVKK